MRIKDHQCQVWAILLSVILVSPLAAQVPGAAPENPEQLFGNKGMGVKEEPAARASERPRLSLSSAEPLVGLPPEKDLRDQFAPVADQGQQSSCLAFAMGEALASFYLAQQGNWTLRRGCCTPDYDRVMSPAFIYNSLNHGVDEGLTFSEAVEFVQRTGNVPWNRMPYNDGDYLSRPSLGLLSEAGSYRLPEFATIWDQSSSKTSIDSIKLAISQGTPVVVGLRLNKAFWQVGNGIWSDDNDLGIVQGRHAHHAVTVVGYDTAVGPHGAFRIRNSWGPKWGDQGYGWVAFELFAKAATTGVTVKELPQPQPTPDKPTPLPQPRPGFIVLPPTNALLVAANWTLVKPGDSHTRVFELLGGPSYGPMGGFNPETGRPNRGLAFFDSPGEAFRLILWFGNDGLVEKKPERQDKGNAPPADPQKVLANWMKINIGDSHTRVFELLGGPSYGPMGGFNPETGRPNRGLAFFDSPGEAFRLILWFGNDGLVEKKPERQDNPRR